MIKRCNKSEFLFSIVLYQIVYAKKGSIECHQCNNGNYNLSIHIRSLKYRYCKLNDSVLSFAVLQI